MKAYGGSPHGDYAGRILRSSSLRFALYEVRRGVLRQTSLWDPTPPV